MLKAKSFLWGDLILPREDLGLALKSKYKSHGPQLPRCSHTTPLKQQSILDTGRRYRLEQGMSTTKMTRGVSSMVRLYLAAMVLICASFVWAVPATLETRQAPNQVAINDPTDQTASLNVTMFILPIPLSEASSIASPYKLLPNHGLPTSVIPDGYFPIQVRANYFYDIRQKALGIPLQVPQLTSLALYLPFIDVLGDGKTAFKRSAIQYFDQILPTLVGGLTQFQNGQVAFFDPAHAAYKPSGGNTLSFTAAQGISNPIDGPGIVNPIFQAVFQRTSSSPISAAKHRSILAQPLYTTPGTGCNMETILFNYTNANPSFVTGDVQTFTPFTNENNDYKNAHGYTAAT